MPHLEEEAWEKLKHYLDIFGEFSEKDREASSITWQVEEDYDAEWFDGDLEKESQAEMPEKPLVVSETPALGIWVITNPSRASNGSCLHVIGNCYRLPGFHYTSWNEVVEPVSSSAFKKKACRQCFPRGYPVIENSPAELLQEEVDDCMPSDAARDDISSSESS